MFNVVLYNDPVRYEGAHTMPLPLTCLGMEAPQTIGVSATQISVAGPGKQRSKKLPFHSMCSVIQTVSILKIQCLSLLNKR